MYIAFASPPRAAGRIASLIARKYDSEIVVFSMVPSYERYRKIEQLLIDLGSPFWRCQESCTGKSLGFGSGLIFLSKWRYLCTNCLLPSIISNAIYLSDFTAFGLVESWFRIGVETWVASLYINIFLLVYKLLKRQSAARGSLFANWNVAFFTLSVN